MYVRKPVYLNLAIWILFRSAASGWPAASGNTDNRANSAQFQLKLPTGAKLGNYITDLAFERLLWIESTCRKHCGSKTFSICLKCGKNKGLCFKFHIISYQTYRTLNPNASSADCRCLTRSRYRVKLWFNSASAYIVSSW